MTIDEIVAVARRVSFKNPPFPVQCTIEVRAGMLGVMAVIIMHVPDRETGHHRRQFYEMPLYLEVFEDEQDVLTVMFEAARSAFLHELDECWHVDGVRTRDPHG